MSERRSGSIRASSSIKPTSRLTLPDIPETARVREAKEVARSACEDTEPDPRLVNWAMKLIEARDEWSNTRRRGSSAHC